MYLDGKCFIPLLPLFVYTIAIFIEDIRKKNYNYKALFTITYIIMLIIAFTNLNYKYLYIFVIDNACIFFGLLLYKYKHKEILFYVPITLFMIILCFSINNNDKLVKRQTLKDINNINDSININYDKN